MKISRVVAIVVSFTLFSCGGSTDTDKIGDAQFCFDNLDSSPSSSEVNECVSKVDGLSGPGAEGIRCTGGFVREGFGSVQKIVNSFTAIQGGTDSSSMQAMLSLLTFTSENTVVKNYNNVDSTFQSCLASGGKGSTLLSSFAFFAMGLIRFYVNKGGCSTAPPYDLQNCVTGGGLSTLELGQENTVDADAQSAQAGIGAVIVSTYKLSCSGTGANKDLCALLKSAYDAGAGGTKPRAVAVKFFKDVLNIP